MGGGQSKLLATFDGFRCLETLKVSKSSTENKKGFTLAEVLITLGIIGVVAVMTMPILVQNVQSRIKEKRIENIHQKLSKATDKMAVQSGLTGYGSTMAFVQEMSKHIKLAKICDNDHLVSCWPVEKVVTRKDGTTWNIQDTKTFKDLKIFKTSLNDYDDTVGIVTADGTNIILSYNKNCDFNVDTMGLKFDKETGKSNTLQCLSGVYDWNGGKNPNKLGDDVITLGVALGLGNSCAFEFDGKCYSTVFNPEPVTRAECGSMKSTFGIQGCYYDKDYWAGAVKQCGNVNNLPKLTQLKVIVDYINAGNRMERLSYFGFSSYNFWMWSGEEYSYAHAYTSYVGTNPGTGAYSRDGSAPPAMCVGD